MDCGIQGVSVHLMCVDTLYTHPSCVSLNLHFPFLKFACNSFTVLHVYRTYIQDASLLLQTLQTLLSTSLSNLEVKSFVDVEVALRMMYLAGEAVTDKVRVVCNNHCTRALAPTSIKHSYPACCKCL